jgi:hypothetical protein
MSRSSSFIEPLEVRALLSAGTVAAPDLTAGAATDVAVLSSATAATPQPSGGGFRLTKIVRQPFTARLGEFHFKTVDQLLSAVIDWGDGTHSAGKVVGSYATGDWYVVGTHTYEHIGTRAVDVKVFARPAGAPIRPTSPIVELTSVIKAKTLRPSEGGVNLIETTGKEFTARLGEFTKKVVDLALDAIIDWGDGTHSKGKLVGSYATGEYYVEGTHSYGHAGTYKVDVKIFAHPVGSPILPTSPVAKFTSVIKVVDKT